MTNDGCTLASESLGEDEKIGRKKQNTWLYIVFGHFLKRAMDPLSSFMTKLRTI